MPTSDIPEVEAVKAHTCGLDGSARWDGFRDALSALETALRTARQEAADNLRSGLAAADEAARELRTARGERDNANAAANAVFRGADTVRAERDTLRETLAERSAEVEAACAALVEAFVPAAERDELRCAGLPRLVAVAVETVARLPAIEVELEGYREKWKDASRRSLRILVRDFMADWGLGNGDATELIWENRERPSYAEIFDHAAVRSLADLREVCGG